jgi:hypothetical protein
VRLRAREGLIAEAIEGRVANATFTTRGELVTTMALDKCLAHIPEIRDYHLGQNGPADYELELVLTDGSSRVLDRIRQALTALYGGNGRFTLTAVPALLPGPSGKFRRTQYNVDFDQKGLFV